MEVSVIKYRIHISFISMIGIVIFAVSIPVLYKGIMNQIALGQVIDDWEQDIYPGAYLEAEIDIKELMQTIAHSPFKKDELIPISHQHGIIFMEGVYLLKKEYDKKTYIPLIATGSELEAFQEFVLQNQGKYYLQGKIIQLKQRRYYDIAMHVTGFNTNEEIDQIVHTEYAIQLIDFDQEKKIIYIGAALMVTGIILFLQAIKRNYQ